MKLDLLLPPPIMRPGFGVKDNQNVSAFQAELVDRFQRKASLWDRLMMAGMLIAAPFICAAMAAALTGRLGARVRRESGVGVLRQWAGQMAVGLRWLMPPTHYYLFELYREGGLACAMDYVLRSHTKQGILPLFKNKFDPAHIEHPFKDKAVLTELCQRHKIAVVPTLLSIDQDDGSRWLEGSVALPHADLFVKPCTGQGGRGAERWMYRDGRWHRRGRGLNQDDLIAHLVALSKDQAVMVQPRMVNHADLMDVNAGTLATMRMVTLLDENLDPTVAAAAFRMPSSATSEVDNFHAGGIAAAVDIASGRLGRATDMGLTVDSRWHDVHPLTGARIEGRILPMWPQAVALAIAAHRLFGNRIVIGWDIAVTPEGPVIIEANGFPDFDIVQRTQRLPLGNTRIASLFALHLRRLQRVRAEQV